MPSEVKPTEPVECPPSNCDDQRCPFGVDEFVDERGCTACRCSNPCYVHQCPEDMACAVEVYRAENGAPRAQPVCRLKNKPGYCPMDFTNANSLLTECIDRCRTDADCRGHDKCCNNGCAHVCVPQDIFNRTTPAPTTPSRVIVPYEPYPAGARGEAYEEAEIIAIAGTEAVLECVESSVYGRQASWSKDGQPLFYISDRKELLTNGSLRISSVESGDRGTYACSIDTSKTKYIKLIVHGKYHSLIN